MVSSPRSTSTGRYSWLNRIGLLRAAVCTTIGTEINPKLKWPFPTIAGIVFPRCKLDAEEPASAMKWPVCYNPNLDRTHHIEGSPKRSYSMANDKQPTSTEREWPETTDHDSSTEREYQGGKPAWPSDTAEHHGEKERKKGDTRHDGPGDLGVA
jgi:hypothetical protein